MTREKGNLGFLMYVADSIGYLGVVGVLLAQKAVKVEGTFISYFLFICWIAAGLSVLCLIASWWYFAVRSQPKGIAQPAEGDT
jgi:hypothetical protein